jgi:hypothetical protein
MTNLNVGDKVEILSDATYLNGTSVLNSGFKSAIGKIGIVTDEIDSDGEYTVN